MDKPEITTDPTVQAFMERRLLETREDNALTEEQTRKLRALFGLWNEPVR